MTRTLLFKSVTLAAITGCMVMLTLVLVQAVGQLKDQVENCAGGISRLIP